MKVQGLMLVLLIPWVVHAEQQYYGTRVSRLALSGSEFPADIEKVPLHTGDVITTDNVRSSIQTLYDTGHYSYIEVDATPAGEGSTNLDFKVRANMFFSTVQLDPEDLLDRPLSTYLRVPYGDKFSKAKVDNLVQDATDLIKSDGYFEAVVKPEYDIQESTHLVYVTLKVIPGPKARVGTVQIQSEVDTFSEKELLDAFGIKAGHDFSAAKVDKGIANIRAKFANLGFLNTKVTPDRNYSEDTHTVAVNLSIQPGQFTYVKPVNFDIPQKKLRTLVPVFEEGSVDLDLVEEGRVHVERYMQQEGYFEANVSSSIIPAPLDNAIQINYTITPGVRHEVSSVTIEGNQYFTADDIQHRMKIRPSQFLNRGIFSVDLLHEDEHTIEVMYRNAGFEGTTVHGEFGETDHVIHVTMQIQEGKQLPIDSLHIAGNAAVTEDEIRKALPIKEGDIYVPETVDRSRALITQMYYANGYSDVRVDRRVNHAAANSGLEITFQITEGDLHEIGNILVAGNTLTKEKTIRLNSKLKPNSPYNPEAILEGQQRLYATGLFSRVEIVPITQSSARVRDLLIQVEDAKPILVTYGAGYQEFEHARGTIEVSHNNLFGLAKSISFRARGSLRERLAETTYREPRLFNHNLDGFVSALAEYAERPFYKVNRVDFAVRVLKPLSAQNRENLLFTSGYQTVNVQDVRVFPHAISLPPEHGPCQVCQIARVGVSLIQDHRNDLLNPSTGSFSTTTFQVASRALGSELNFTSLFNQSSFYSPLAFGVFATSIRFGWNHPFGQTDQLAPGQNQKLPPTERYFAGGSTTLRGFSLDEAQPSGGNVMTIGNFEYRFPMKFLPLKNVGGAFFYDTGNVFSQISDIHLGSFSHTIGTGLRYQTPIGPVRLDFGLNLKPNVNGQNEKRFHIFFTLGNPF